jgi:hypothetical protein
MTKEFRYYLSEKYEGLKWFQEPYKWIYDTSECQSNFWQKIGFEQSNDLKILWDILYYTRGLINN